ncbi:MAG: Lrp/AsnC family transcriptional regulator [Candidatus Aenigmarchaeota archaeon]|nr:Lrp/AsnC family transcriptional regulator [Candidatus Aenigmarchaeota archaeon]
MLKKKDRLLLKELIENSREKITRLAERCHMTRQSVYAKINSFRTRGMNFTVDVNPEEVGLNMKVYILIEAEPQAKFREEADKEIRQFKEITQVHHILGRFDIIVEALVKERDDLRKLLKKIHALPAVKKTETFIVYETTKFNLRDPIIEALSE